MGDFSRDYYLINYIHKNNANNRVNAVPSLYRSACNAYSLPHLKNISAKKRPDFKHADYDADMIDFIKPYLSKKELKCRKIAVKVAKNYPITLYEDKYLSFNAPEIKSIATDAGIIGKKLQMVLLLCDSCEEAEAIVKHFVDVTLEDSKENPIRAELYLEAIHNTRISLDVAEKITL